MIPLEFSKSLLRWYDCNGRKELPWRQNITPYRVWISEIMLQQTQVKTVISYFQRFIQRFPTVTSLAEAAEDEVLHMWTGLGYYARARNLHRAAKHVVALYDGVFPNNLADLQALSGVGRSTAGAILAIAMNKRAAILDGNVRRILSRVHAISGLPTSTPVIKQLWALADQYTPEERIADYTQAIMDLGAMLCSRTKPNCGSCPLKKGCQAYQQGRATDFPLAKPRKIIPIRSIRMIIFSNPEEDKVFIVKRSPIGVWGSLWSFPECPIDANVQEWCKETYRARILNMQELPNFKHVFSHFQLIITPVYISSYEWTNQVMDSMDRMWYSLKNPSSIGFAAPIKCLLNQIKELQSDAGLARTT